MIELNNKIEPLTIYCYDNGSLISKKCMEWLQGDRMPYLIESLKKMIAEGKLDKNKYL